VGKNLYLCMVAFLLGTGHLPAQALPRLSGQKITLRLLSRVSSKNPNGSPFVARLNAPLEAGGNVLLPEGTILRGEITTKHARRLYRSGSLRFVFESLSLPGGRTAEVDLALQAIQAGPNDHHRMAVRLDDEGGVHPHLSRKKLLLNIGISLAIGKVADDASETVIRSLGMAGARYFAWGSGAAFLLLRSKGASVKLPPGTRLEAVFQREPSFQSPLAILPLAASRGFATTLDDFCP